MARNARKVPKKGVVENKIVSENTSVERSITDYGKQIVDSEMPIDLGKQLLSKNPKLQKGESYANPRSVQRRLSWAKEMEGKQDQIAWSSFVLGSSPPYAVMNKHFRNLWGHLGVDKYECCKGYGHLMEKCRLDPKTQEQYKGDFSILAQHEKMGGREPQLRDMEYFKMCVDECGLEDMRQIGSNFSWCNMQLGEDRIMAKLDSVLINRDWIIQQNDSLAELGEDRIMAKLDSVLINRDWIIQQNASLAELGEDRIMAKLDSVLINRDWIIQQNASLAEVLNAGISDHNPIMIRIAEDMVRKTKPFKYFNMWKLDPDYPTVVTASCQIPIQESSCGELQTLADALLCKKKSQRGLAFKDAKLWNEASIMKQVWWLAQCENNLLVRWMHEIYQKHANIWDVEAKADSSWQWKAILKVRDRAREAFEGSIWKLNSSGKYCTLEGYYWLVGQQGM
ncbi:OLC1v1013534C1 [Oldenlandia corymbosa var. corymbosa]|uniref:OLC1v1013534C1 n=1 Tax=Oldenlandia corymbosa var. corymbosa TaxID=529605 RepID=A0AAV1E234_OLDCO|nr:OLC1v1013534C1 [Oldenlandia corymbosa var. corymbosa]